MEQRNSDQIFDLRMAKRKPIRFEFKLDPQNAQQLTDALDLIEVKKLSFEGVLSPLGKSDWTLEGDIGATVVQACRLSLAPVPARLDTTVHRHFSQSLVTADYEAEMEMPSDDDRDPLPDQLHLIDVLIEVLSLELPDFPTADGAAFESKVFADRGIRPMTDDDAKPFAGLAGLKDKLTPREN